MKVYPNRSNYELREVEQYKKLISTIPGGIIITEADDNFTIIFANQGYYAMVGYEREAFFDRFGTVGTDTLHPDEAQDFAASAKAQMAKTGMFSLNGKLKHKEKGYIWVQFSGRLEIAPDGNSRIYIVLLDISEHQYTLEKLKKEQSFSDMIADLSDEAFFDCDLVVETMRYSKNFAKRLGVSEFQGDYQRALTHMGFFTKENQWVYKKQFLKAADDIYEHEVQVTLPTDETVWYLCRYNIIKGLKDEPVRIVGKFIDITRHKVQIDELAELAQKDQLTGLYNKTMTETLIKETLKMRRIYDEHSALMIIDIDNFKTINDRLGHLYGDAVLTQLAEYLKSSFRSDDIVGRVGGDEFFVFLKNYGSTELLQEKAEQIGGLFHKTYSEGDAFVTISASIGIALCPEHGTELDGLYIKADAALYDIKAKGKNNYSFYNIDLTQSYTSVRTEIDASIMNKSFKDNRIEYVFKLLYDSENPASSIQSVLQLVTESFGFSRGYIFENSMDKLFTSNTFEWCAKDITAEIHNLQNLPIETVNTAAEAFCDNGMFILKSIRNLPKLEREILEPQGIRSMFQFGIMDMGKFMGFIGFDDCNDERIPRDQEIDEICTVCHVLATFVLKYRSGERELRHHKAIETVMDNMNGLAYVIDKDDYNILYENQSVVRLDGENSLGKRCYKVYRNKEKPCEDCPIKHLKDGKKRHTLEIYNKKFEKYMRTEVTTVDWSENKKAYLISSVDISEYKKD